MMGPLDASWRNSPLLEAGITGNDLTASDVLVEAKRVLPVIIAAAPTTALRIRKLRRSTPVGTSRETSWWVSASGSSRTALGGSSVELNSPSNFSSSLSDMVYLNLSIRINQPRTASTAHLGPICLYLQTPF